VVHEDRERYDEWHGHDEECPAYPYCIIAGEVPRVGNKVDGNRDSN